MRSALGILGSKPNSDDTRKITLELGGRFLCVCAQSHSSSLNFNLKLFIMICSVWAEFNNTYVLASAYFHTLSDGGSQWAAVTADGA